MLVFKEDLFYLTAVDQLRLVKFAQLAFNKKANVRCLFCVGVDVIGYIP
jgi:hypothetical protein